MRVIIGGQQNAVIISASKKGGGIYTLVIKSLNGDFLHSFPEQLRMKHGEMEMRVPDFRSVGKFRTSRPVRIDVLEHLLRLDSSDDANDGPGTDKKSAGIVVSTDGQVGIFVAVQI